MRSFFFGKFLMVFDLLFNIKVVLLFDILIVWFDIWVCYVIFVIFLEGGGRFCDEVKC